MRPQPKLKLSERHSSAALLALTTAVLILVLAGVLFAAEVDAPATANLAVAPGAPTTALTGWLHTLFGDTPSGGGDHMHTHLLVDDNGRATKLSVPDSVVAAAGGRGAINHRRVTVNGQPFSPLPSASGAAAPLFSVHTITVDGGATSPSGVSPLGAQALVSGSQKWVSVLCRFADSANVTPYPKTWFETLMLGGQAPGLDHYWRQSSFSAINLTGSVVVGWYTLPHPRSYYVYGNPLELDAQRAADDCTAAADADVYFPSFIGINLMFNDDLDCCAWGGSTSLLLDGQMRMYRITWLPPWGYESQGPIAHEMGHGFGLPHSSGPYDQTYDSRWDVMSDVWGNCPPWDPTYGCVGTHTISYHKDLLGWIPSNRRYVAAPGTTETITLEPLDQLATSGYMIARIPLPGSTTRFYTVETRRLAGYDTPLPGHAVVIHLVDTTRADRDAQVVDPDADGDPDDAGAMWLPGETFIDPENGISVAVLSAAGQGFVVTVSASAGGPASYTLSVTVTGPGTVTSNPAGIACSGGTCLASFPSGSNVTLATSGGTLAGWGGACAGAGACTVTMTGNRAASATFSTGSPDITLSPSAVAFGTVPVGGKGNQTVTVKNDGTANLVLGTIALAGTDADQFMVVAGSNLCAGRTLAAGQSCTVLVRFKPKTAGVKSAKLKIASNDPDEAPAKVTVSGTASGAVAVPEITVTPESLPFGTLAVGVKSIQTVTVKNDGTANLMLGTVGLSTESGEISLVAGQDLCSGVSLGPGQACTIAVKIKPASSGAKTASLSIPSNDADETVVSVSVGGTAL